MQASPAQARTTSEADGVDLARIQQVFSAQQATALAWRESTAQQRIARIMQLRDAVLANRESLYAAAEKDFRKPRAEVDLAEIMPILESAKDYAKHLRRWMKPLKVGSTLSTIGSSAHVQYQPRGRCLIIAPWNYPINLGFLPLIACLAAGNTAILKPSELAPNIAAWMAKVIAQAFPENEVAVFEGEVDVAKALLELPFDHSFFTGSPAVGKLVMAAAARHLTSVTLELGGKSPTIVDESADIKAAAENVTWGKLLNNGQTCVAPDHVYVAESVKAQFIEHALAAIRARFGATAEEQRQSPDLARVVNPRHARRLAGLIEDARDKGAQVLCGAEASVEDCYVAPTLLDRLPADAQIMEEEIFGPILPVIGFETIDEVIGKINAAPKPLALYVFSRNQDNIDAILQRTSSGGACINHVVVQINHDKLPFGGVNNSGLGGSYHGIWGFRCFSHERSVMRQHVLGMRMLYPPYTPGLQRLLRWMEKLIG